MQVLQMIFYTAVLLGVLIFIHELGHFLAAKLTGMRVDRFSIGFPPRAFGKKIGDTDYCVSWIPFGGYVKIAGMVDESFDTDYLHHAPEPWEFRSKPMWARIVVISAGVTMNTLLAIVLFWGTDFAGGKFTIDTTEIGYVADGSPAARAGIAEGDRVLAINGKPVSTWDELEKSAYVENLGNDLVFTVGRQGSTKDILIPQDSLKKSPEKSLGMIQAHVVPVVRNVDSNMPAGSLGLKGGDTLISIDGRPAGYPGIISMIKAHAGRPMVLEWNHGGSMHSGTATVTAEGRIGVVIEGAYTGPSHHTRYSLGEAFVSGLGKTGDAVYLFYLTISKIIAGKTSVRESFGGPIAIAQLATQSAQFGLLHYLEFMALLSMSLAILNILPFPALDGGHLAMLLYEKFFGREIPNRVKIVIQQAGFILLLAFMAFVVFNDLSRF